MSSGADVASDTRVGGLQSITCNVLTQPRQTLTTNLARFAYKPEQKQRSDIQESMTSSLASPGPADMAYNPPAQSRDATNGSRFFPATPSNGTVLVPDSSPLTKDAGHQAYRPFQYSHDGSLMSGASHQNNWSQSFKNHADPLSRPSGFVASTGVNNAYITRRVPPSGRRPIDVDGSPDGERPRKRANLESPGADPLDLFAPESPLSPDIVRAGQKRKIVTARPLVPTLSVSSDESSPDAKASVDNVSRPRIVRGGAAEDKGLVALRMVHPQLAPRTVDAAYYLANKDVRTATNLLNDPDFDPSAYRPSSSTSTPNSVRVVGKVKEVEEEREAKRAEQKQIALKSSIYKHRQTVDSPSASTSSLPASPAVVDVDSSPIRPRPIRSKPRRQVVESESEAESESEREEPQNQFEKQTLESFNSFGVDSLQELTGMSYMILTGLALIMLRLYPRTSGQDHFSSSFRVCCCFETAPWSRSKEGRPGRNQPAFVRRMRRDLRRLR